MPIEIPTPRLTAKERGPIQVALYKFLGFNDQETLEFVENHNAKVSSILNEDAEIINLAGQGEYEAAAEILKRRLEESGIIKKQAEAA